MLAAIKDIATSTLHLFYPHVCTGCGSDLLNEGDQLCLRCIHSLPHTHFAGIPGNPIERYFWGRLPVHSAHSEFYFAKEFLIQHLIHQLKYKSNTDIGIYLGEMMGKSLSQSKRFNTLDAIIPLPLYPDKERKRGYNQAAIICQGMSSVMNVPVMNNAVIRQYATETQTRKQRTERWQNVSGSFLLAQPELLARKHLLLVDDVITTGATLEACGTIMLQQNTRLSIATLAYAAK